MTYRHRLLELVLLLALVALGILWFRGGQLSVAGVRPGMTSQEVDRVLRQQEERPYIAWGADGRVERVEGRSLERGGRPLLGPQADRASVVRALGQPDRERVHTLGMPGRREETTLMLYRLERLTVERSADGSVAYQLL